MWKFMATLLVLAQLVQVSANPFVLRAAGKRLANKQVLLKVEKGGKTLLHNLRSGKIKNIRFQFDKMVKMPRSSIGSVTKEGFMRNAKHFWGVFKNKYGSALSNKNRLRIKNGKAPVVDRTWVKKFKEHAPFMGEKLEHHHLKHGGFAVPLPKSLHRGKGNSGFFHW